MSARFKRWVVSATACMLTLSQVMMPVQAAYASGGGNNGNGGGSGSSNAQNSDEPKKVYVCKYVGTPGVNERLQTGQNPIEVSVKAVDSAEVGEYFNDQQGRSYVLGTVPMTPEPSVTDCPNVVDAEEVMINQMVVCGPNNDVLTATAVENVTFTMSEWMNNMRTVTATLDAGFSWSDGTSGLVKTYSFTDANTKCDEPTPISVPQVMPTDPCGLNNASWTIPSSDGQPYTFSLVDGELIVTANENYVFIEYGASYNYRMAQDSGELCPVSQCTVSSAMYQQPWTYDEATYPEAGTIGEGTAGSFNFEPTGLYLSTPDADSYVYGMFDGGNTPIADVDAMSYKTLRLAMSAGYEGTQPAYILLVDTNGADVAGGEKYFFYEPYNNDATAAATEGVWQTWDTIDGGNATWYVSGTGQALRSWSSLVSEFPDAVVLSFGFNQGTSNAETFTAVQDIKFDCATVRFNNTQTGGSGGSGGETPTIPTTPVTPAPVTPAAAVGELPAELPYTGAPQNMTGIYGLLIALITYAAVYFGQPRKRLDFND